MMMLLEPLFGEDKLSLSVTLLSVQSQVPGLQLRMLLRARGGRLTLCLYQVLQGSACRIAPKGVASIRMVYSFTPSFIQHFFLS